MDIQWQELIDWFNELPAERMQYFVEIRQLILDVHPGVYKAMQEIIQNQVLLSLICDDTRFMTASWVLLGDGVGTSWMEIVYDATGDTKDARWWQQVFLIETAIRHRERLFAGRP